MQRLLVVEDDNAVRNNIVTCLELEGLSGLGDTAQEALAELRVAVELAIDEFTEAGTEIPMPMQSASHSGQLRLRLPKTLHAKLAARAEHEGVSLNALILSYVATGVGDAEARHRGRFARASRQAG